MSYLDRVEGPLTLENGVMDDSSCCVGVRLLWEQRLSGNVEDLLRESWLTA